MTTPLETPSCMSDYAPGTYEETDYNAITFPGPFFTDESSVSLHVGGEAQLYTQKKFSHGPHRCFLNLEVRSKLLLNYFFLSAIAMDKEKCVFYSRCWIEHKSSKKQYLMLAVLRSKCLHVRYEFLLCDYKDGKSVFMLCGVSKMALYVFLPDIDVNHDEAKDILSR